MTKAQHCLVHHPLTRAHSATEAAGGQVWYVVCGWGGCAQRREVPVDAWQAELDRREREAPVPASGEPGSQPG